MPAGRRYADRYAEQMSREPVIVLTTRAREFAALWLVGLHACTLRAVSGLGARGAWAAGIILAILFVGVPWMAAPLVGQAMEGLFF